MARITIKSDGNGLFEFALGKVLSGKYMEVSWALAVRFGERKDK